MGDPFSTAAGAISFVSFGIQACQILLSYYDDCKSFSNTVTSLCQKVTELRTTLKICKEVLNRPRETFSTAHTHVLERINVSRDGLDTLKEALGACKKHPKPHGFRANFHNYGQQVLFPFRKPHLQKLESAVSAMQKNVHFGLDILQTLAHSFIQESSSISSDNESAGKGRSVSQKYWRLFPLILHVSPDKALIPMLASFALNRISKTHDQICQSSSNNAESLTMT